MYNFTDRHTRTPRIVISHPGNRWHCRTGRTGLRVLVLGLLCGMGSAAADVLPRAADAERIAEIRRLIEAEMKAHDVPGLSIALVDAEGVRWSQGFGFANTANGRAATTGTLFPTGTLTMALTAAAVMQQVEHGRITLDAPVERYLPEFAPRSRHPDAGPITVRQLLSHHGGLPAMHFQGMMAKRPVSLAAFTARLRDEYVVAPPQQVYVFSHPGYAVLGRLLEKQSGRGYVEQVRASLLEPLGMRRSTFDPDFAGDPGVSLSYRKGREFPRLPVRDVSAIGLYSSAEELAYYVQMLLNDGRVGERRVLRAASVAEMFRAQNRDVALDLRNHVGLGWRLSGMTVAGARRVVWQDGSSPFSGGRLVILPDDGLGLVILGNGNKMWSVAETVSERLLGSLVEKGEPRTAAAPAGTLVVAQGDGKLPELSGHYVTPLGLVTVRGSGKQLRADIFGRTVALVRHPTGWIGVEYRLLGVLPIPIPTLREARLWPAVSQGRTTAVLDHRNQLRRFAEELPTTTLPRAWQQRLGRYAVIDRDPILDMLETRVIDLKYENPVVYFDFRLPGWLGLRSQIPVLPVSDTELVVAGTGWLMGDTIRAVRVDGEERLIYSGYQFRRLRQ
jgi:CubicO group peptidase (beta-lactamase class C family)